MKRSRAPLPVEHLIETAVLLDKIRDGDSAAINDLFDRYKLYLAALLKNRLPYTARGIMETQDLVQDVCLKVLPYLNRFKYKGIGSFWSYIRVIAINHTVAVWKSNLKDSKNNRLPDETNLQPPSKESSPLKKLMIQEQYNSFEETIKKLTDRKRFALLMRLELGIDFSTIAQDCGYPSKSAARMDVYRTIKWVSKEMN